MTPPLLVDVRQDKADIKRDGHVTVAIGNLEHLYDAAHHEHVPAFKQSSAAALALGGAYLLELNMCPTNDARLAGGSSFRRIWRQLRFKEARCPHAMGGTTVGIGTTVGMIAASVGMIGSSSTAAVCACTAGAGSATASTHAHSHASCAGLCVHAHLRQPLQAHIIRGGGLTS